jgi:hypothetical protein
MDAAESGADAPFGLVLILVGLYVGVFHSGIVAYAPAYSHWGAGVAGAFIALIGMATVGDALRWPQWFVHLTIACIVLPLNYWLFMTGIGWLRSVGGTRGPELVRVAVVAVDLYLVYWIIATLLRLEGRRLIGLAGCAALAITFEFSGVIDRVGYSSRLLPPIASGALEARRAEAADPELPLQDYAGTWIAQTRTPSGAAWITRVALRIDAGKPSATLWRGCASGECEAGSYAGIAEGRSAGKAQAVHFAGQTDGRYWIASLRPTLRGGMSLHEQRMRGAYRLTSAEQTSILKRAGP